MISYNIRWATIVDAERVYELVHELAIFEKAPNEHEVQLADFKLHGWGDEPFFKCLVLEDALGIQGICLFYEKYSTWKGPSLFLEELIITQNSRGKGYGKALLNALYAYAKNASYARIEWVVLDWNSTAIAFYEQIGANIDREWLLCKWTVK